MPTIHLNVTSIITVNDIFFSFFITSILKPFLDHTIYHNFILRDPLVTILQSSEGRFFFF